MTLLLFDFVGWRIVRMTAVLNIIRLILQVEQLYATVSQK